MHLARVVGTVVCTHKDARLSGVTLLVIQPVARDGSDVGRALVATDAAGAGVGERVFFVRGREAAVPVPSRRGPDRRQHRRHRGLTRTWSPDVQVGTIVGTVVSTQKHAKLHGAKLLLVQPELPDGTAKGTVVLAIDSVGAGVGERVLFVIEGKAAGDALGRKGAPVDAAIIGIVDALEKTEEVW